MHQLPKAPGVHYLSDIEGVSTFTLSVPFEIASQALPLVISLHYQGSGIAHYGSGLLLDVVQPALKDLGAIMVAPDCQASVWHNEQSEKQVMDLMTIIFDSYNIDRKRTLLTGYSIGGIGTWYMASRHQDLFTMAVPMAARLPAGADEVDWQIPIYAIHGSRDQLFPLADTSEMIDRLRRNGAQVELSVVEGVTHFETGRFYRPLRQLVPAISRFWADAS